MDTLVPPLDMVSKFKSIIQRRPTMNRGSVCVERERERESILINSSKKGYTQFLL